MALGISLVVTAIGAILRYAYTPTASNGFRWGTVGAILMIVGIIGVVISVVAWLARGHRHQRMTSTTERDGRMVRRDDVDSTTTSPL